MWEWAQSRPRYCLKIGPHQLAWAEVRRDWKGRRRYRSTVASVPHGVMRLSPHEPNIADSDELQTRIRTLAGPSRPIRLGGRQFFPGLPRAVTLVLPDLAVRLAVLHLQELPAKHQEREALIRWRLGHEQLLSLTGTKVFFQTVGAAGGSSTGRTTILTVIAQETVLQQYESVCEAVELLPQQVEVASLALFNMWLRTAGGMDRIKSDFLWVNIADGSFTAFIFHKRELVFIRTKPQSISGLDQEGGVESGWVEKILEECGASIYACQQHHPALAVATLVLAGNVGRRTGIGEALQRELGLSVKEVVWEGARFGVGASTEITSSAASLPALAGVV